MRYEMGARLKKYREAKGYTQRQFASLIGVGNSRVSNWEIGISRPDVDLLAVICDALEVSPSDLLDVKKESPAPEGGEVAPDFVGSDDDLRKEIMDAVRKLPGNETKAALDYLLYLLQKARPENY